MATNIEWTNPPGYKGDVWNPTTGCTKVSAGCTNCYAMKMANRLSNIESTKDAYIGTVKKLANGEVNWTGKINLLEDRLSIPLLRNKPTAWFVNSMSDLFHEDIPFDYIDKVFAVMALCPQHIFQVLTKRPGRMREYMLTKNPLPTISRVVKAAEKINETRKNHTGWNFGWPHSNIWLGCSVEDQKTADERIPILLDTPAAVRWISAEPLLGAIDLKHLHGEVVEIDCLNGTHGILRPHSGESNKLDQVIVGGESGSNARPSHPDWFRRLRDQCVASGTAFFFKQFGNWGEGSHANSKERIILTDGRHFSWDEYPKVAKSNWHSLHPMAMANVGKKAAGRILDGRTWDEYPGVKA